VLEDVGSVLIEFLVVDEDVSGVSKHATNDKSIDKTRINKTIFFISAHLSNNLIFFVVINESRTFATHLYSVEHFPIFNSRLVNEAKMKLSAVAKTNEISRLILGFFGPSGLAKLLFEYI
jgi:hypothetical protein